MTKRDAQAYAMLALIVFMVLAGPILVLAAYDWDWRCLFAECRRLK